ncbi:MAG: RDD family protein [Cyclobacteriaceae bacterium]
MPTIPPLEAMTNAGFWPRMMAYNIDFLFYLLFAMILRLAMPSPIGTYIGLSVSVFLFEVIFLHSKWKATPGRRYMGLQVLSKDGNELSIVKIAIRTFLKVVSLLGLFVGFMMIFIRNDRRAFHEIISGSRTVFRKET